MGKVTAAVGENKGQEFSKYARWLDTMIVEQVDTRS